MKRKPPTIKEIAKRLNISFSTVSRALHDHPSIGLRTKMRVKELAKELNYEPIQTAIFFQQRKTFTLGVILPKLSEAFFSTALCGIEDEAERNNYTVLIGQSHDSEEREKHLVETMRNRQVDGILVSLAKNTVSYDHFDVLKRNNVPLVFFDRIPNMSNINYVACNMVSGTIEAVYFLLKNGHRVIGMINGPEKLLASQERKDGYIQAMMKKRLKYDPELIVYSDLTKEGTYEATKNLLDHKRKPTAIVTFNDYVALDAVQCVKKSKLKSDRDICFVSYANLPISSYTAFPPLASVEQYPYLQGKKATELLLDLVKKNSEENPGGSIYKKIILDSQLVLH